MKNLQTRSSETTGHWSVFGPGRWARRWADRLANGLANHFVDRLKDRLLVCNRFDCSRSSRAWYRLSDGAGSVRLDGLRYCFPRCFERELTRRFQGAQSVFDVKPRPPHRVPLGLLMLSRGDLDSGQLRHALHAQRESGTGRIGEWIEKLGYAHEHQVTAALATQWACPVLRRLPARAADCGVPYQLLKRFHMVPVHFARVTRVLHVAFSADIEYPALLAIEQMLECKTAPCLAVPAALAIVLGRMDEEERKSEKVFDGHRLPEEMTRIISSYAARLGAEQLRTVVCGNYVWVRIEGEPDPTNLLLARMPSEIVASAGFSARSAG